MIDSQPFSSCLIDMISLTLNKLKRPALLNLVPKFGTLVEKNDINKGGLSTAEVDVNMTLPFELMREIEVSSSDTRFLRRMVRDARTRGTSAKKTIAMWGSVRRGEELNIFPFQEEADVMFNSACIYELSVLKKYAKPLLEEIKEDAKSFERFKLTTEVTGSRIVPEWLEGDMENLRGTVKALPTREQIDTDVEETLIVELYSK